MNISPERLSDLLVAAKVGDFSDKVLLKLAYTLDFSTYAQLAGIESAHHTFWRWLLPSRMPQQARCLVLESRLGTLTAALAGDFKTVVSWHTKLHAAAITKERLRMSDISNVTVVVGQGIEEILGLGPFNAIISYGLAEDPMEQWKGREQALLAHLSRHVLKESALPLSVLVACGNNSWAYRTDVLEEKSQLRANLACMELHTRAMHTAGMLASKGSLTVDHLPLPDFLSYGNASVAAHGPLGRAKQWILNSKIGRLFWPAYLFVGYNSKAQSRLATLAEQSVVRERLGWPAEMQVEVKRIVAGNLGTTIALLGIKGKEYPDVIARLPSNGVGERLCTTNASALRALSNSNSSGLVPRLLYEGNFEGGYITLEECRPGSELGYESPNAENFLLQACVWMQRLQMSEQRLEKNFSEADFERLIDPLITHLLAIITEARKSKASEIRDALRKAMCSTNLAMGITHGDFKLSNLLCRESQQISGIIDWDGYDGEGIQIFDFLTLIFYKIANETGNDFTAVYLNYFLPWKLPDKYSRLANAALNHFEMTEDSFRYARVAYWFVLLAKRINRIYQFHEDWQVRYLDKIFPSLLQACAKNIPPPA